MEAANWPAAPVSEAASFSTAKLAPSFGATLPLAKARSPAPPAQTSIGRSKLMRSMTCVLNTEATSSNSPTDCSTKGRPDKPS